MSLAKIGLHIMEGYAGSLGTPAIVKLVDASPEYLTRVRGLVGPSCTIVVRWTLKGTPLEGQPLDDPGRRARELFEMCLPKMVDPLALYEGYNEVHRDQLGRFALFEAARLGLMHGAGRRSAVGSWAAGTPELADWNDFRPALDAMGPGDAVALHEYFVDGPDTANRWHIGRYEMVPLLADKALVITELGRDRMEGRGYSGWHLDPNCSGDQYLSELRSAGNVYERRPTVLGAVVFTAGRILDPRWQQFEVNSLGGAIAAEGQPAPALPGLPPPEPLPIVDRRLIIELGRPLALTPQTNVVTQWFGANPGMYAAYGMRGHNGLDYRAPAGTPVLASHSGVAHPFDQGGAGLGRYIKLVYFDGEGVERYDTRYAHLSEWRVVEGQRVRRGDVLGLSGNTGNSTGPHLHWDLRVSGMTNPGYGDRIDPTPWRTI